MTAAVFEDLHDLLAAPPVDLGVTDWIVIDAAMTAAFSAATLDVAGDGVPPLMLVSLTNRLLPDLLQVPAAATGVNYGAASIRFGNPVAVGSEVHAKASLIEATEVAGGVQTTVRIEVVARHAEDPCCVVESLSRWLR